ncbi:HU family DNA-binding protein [Candidatus Legionella polyplacis]|uniref:HU family DNA-binding protein n=1 Tax=Candidatus Legionella polyplacis TaxID=2005262 RepID=A0ABZ2H1P0_9GAMM
MNKSELVKVISKNSGITKTSVNCIIDSLISSIVNTLKHGDTVVLPGFGSFYTVLRSERMGRNPQNGKMIHIKASKIIKFRAGKKLKNFL